MMNEVIDWAVEHYGMSAVVALYTFYIALKYAMASPVDSASRKVFDFLDGLFPGDLGKMLDAVKSALSKEKKDSDDQKVELCSDCSVRLFRDFWLRCSPRRFASIVCSGPGKLERNRIGFLRGSHKGNDGM